MGIDKKSLRHSYSVTASFISILFNLLFLVVGRGGEKWVKMKDDGRRAEK